MIDKRKNVILNDLWFDTSSMVCVNELLRVKWNFNLLCRGVKCHSHFKLTPNGRVKKVSKTKYIRGDTKNKFLFFLTK